LVRVGVATHVLGARSGSCIVLFYTLGIVVWRGRLLA